jgi:molecular chaperone GrpE
MEAPDEEAAADADTGDGALSEDLREQLAEACTARDEAVAEAADAKDKMLRALAEAENARTIARRDVESNRKFAVQKFASDVLDVADNLSRAADSVPEQYRKLNGEDGEPDGALKALVSFYEGVNMTEAAMQTILNRYDVVKFVPLDEKVDPELHDIKLNMPDPEKEPGTVGLVIRPGYMIADRVLRPAEVGVVAA